MNFPNVPNLPGVPPIPRAITGSSAGQAIVGLASAAVLSGIGNFLFPNTWSIVDPDGNPLTDFDSMINLSYNHEYKITDAPVENGSLATFNKVNTPAEIKIKLTKYGSDSDRSQFILDIGAAAKSTIQYTIHMRELSAGDSYNLVSYSFIRSAETGTSMIAAILTFKIVFDVTVAYSTTQNAQNPASASSVSSGVTQATSAGSSLLSKGASAVSSTIGKLGRG